jgi:hypothetical protein
MLTVRNLSFVFFILLIGCKSHEYLPKPAEIGTSTHGAYIQSYLDDGTRFSGELIAIDSIHIIVLSEKDQQCKQYPTKELGRYSLRYAQSKNYAWTIPVFSLLTLMHGYIAVFTFPVNLITTIAVTVGAQDAFVYKKSDMPVDKLHLFARFPQGLPKGLALSEIK